MLLSCLKVRAKYVKALQKPCLGCCPALHWFNCSFIVLSVISSLADKYAVRFIPHENGIHSIDVKFNGSHVVGSPFKVRVGEPGQAGNPALVTAYGAGLESGTTGNPAFTALIQTCWLWDVERGRTCS